MLDKSFYHGQQGECFRQLDKHWKNIKHEFDTQPNKTFLDPEDFSDSVRGLPEDFDDKSGDYVQGQWRALGIQSGDHEGQSLNDYPILYSILRKFPYKTNVAIMTVGPNTKIGNHTDNEGGWRYQPELSATLSMTCAGISSLVIASGFPDGRTDHPFTASLL